ncbi:MAG: hypothetical protein IKX88_12780, partial [Thermoguttaceae bacterium]|nr:hypothetical protein [Thermoguttaceae bacterium]
MLNRALSLRLSIGVCLLSCLVAFGCREKPELSFSEYGETIDHLPVVDNLPDAFPIDQEMEPKDCSIREDSQGHQRRSLYKSQGREEELRELEKAEEERAKLERAQIASQPEEPATEEPTTEEPAVEEPVVEEPVVEEPAAEEPAVEEAPAVEEPAAEEPAVEEAPAV